MPLLDPFGLCVVAGVQEEAEGWETGVSEQRYPFLGNSRGQGPNLLACPWTSVLPPDVPG